MGVSGLQVAPNLFYAIVSSPVPGQLRIHKRHELLILRSQKTALEIKLMIGERGCARSLLKNKAIALDL